MSTPQPNELTPRTPLRVWPGVAAAVLMVLVRFGTPVVFPDQAILGVLGAVLLAVVILVWWVFFSRAPWLERLGAILLMIAATFATRYVVHESIRGGLMGRMLPIYLAIPGLSLALVAWVVASRGLAPASRRAALVATILLTCGVFTLLRTDGITGDAVAQLAWRWTPTAEDRLLAQGPLEPLDATRGGPPTAAPIASAPATSEAPTQTRAEDTPSLPSAPAVGKTPVTGSEVTGGEKALTPPAGPANTTPLPTAKGTRGEGPFTSESTIARVGRPATSERTFTRVEWPGFRGSNRDGIVRGVRVETNWTASPPVELWRRPIGPGWSSFAVAGDRLYTQEQRGEQEIVACYNATTGKPVWIHRDAVRFYESNGGTGPRATPALSNGRVYALGATGILNALDAGNGALVWSRNAVTDGGVKVPGWGIAGSPLVVGDLVVVAASGALVAYDRAAGERRWILKSTGGSYSSPQLVTIDGIAQIVLLGGSGARSVAPADGTVLWEYAWEGTPIVQPNITADGDVLITTGDAMGGLGTRRLAVAHGPGGWKVDERWTSNGLKPYFNDYVVHKGHAFGFDGSILACLDLEDGKRKWKGGRYGHGQIVLLPDQDLLLVLSEEGELALVKAAPDQFTEVARVPAIKGKTWNHPALVGDILLVRNGEEMAAFRLTLAGR